MAQKAPSTKRLQIVKANKSMIVVIAVASFISIFSLVASRALLQQRGYQSKVIEKKKTALRQLQANNAAATELVSSYQTFVSQPTNVIGGSSTGKSDRDGDNAKITLDALPSRYDFPAVTSSLEKILSDRKFEITNISGTDDEVNQQKTAGDVAVPIPYEFEVESDYKSVQSLIVFLEQSIRPMKVNKLIFEASEGKVKLEVQGETYYQPITSLDIKKEVVR